MKRFETLAELNEALKPYGHEFEIVKTGTGIENWYYADTKLNPLFYYITGEELECLKVMGTTKNYAEWLDGKENA